MIVYKSAALRAYKSGKFVQFRELNAVGAKCVTYRISASNLILVNVMKITDIEILNTSFFT